MSKVWLVGAGPGDKDLISVKGLSLIRQADAILYDALIDNALLDEAKEGCVLIEAGKRMGRHSMKQDEINAAILEAASRYECVVRLKGGDPFIFGRGGEEAMALIDAGADFEVVPGITSSTSAAMKAGIPVTHRGVARSFHVITGHTEGDELDYGRYAGIEGTLVFLMGLNMMDRICGDLVAGGMDPSMPAAVISRAYMDGEKVIRAELADLTAAASAQGAEAPAVIVVGETAAMDLRCRDTKGPAHTAPVTKVLTVGTERFENNLKEALKKYGIGCRTLLRVEPAVTEEGKKALAAALNNIENYSRITFASQNAIRLFFGIANEAGFDRRRLASLKLAVIGSATADALREYGYKADLIPSDFTGHSLAEAIAKEKCTTHRVRGTLSDDDCRPILTIRAESGSEDMYEVFDREGISYERIELYRLEPQTVPRTRCVDQFRCVDCADRFDKNDIIALGSASGVRNLWKAFGPELTDKEDMPRFACIGEYTAEELRRHGAEPAAVSDPHTAEGLAKAIEEYLKGQKK